MKLNIEKIKQFIGKSVDFESTEHVKSLKHLDEEVFFADNVCVSGNVKNIGTGLFEVIGKIKTAVYYSCYRCLEKTRVSFNIDFSIKFSDLSFNIESKNEDVIRFSGDEIEILPQIINEIILNWPAQVLCKPDCKGLCQKCGANLNITECDCKRIQIDPRLAVLKKLKDVE